MWLRVRVLNFAPSLVWGIEMKDLTHVDEKGVKMVEVGHKDVVFRKAVAKGRIRLKPETIELIKAGKTKKGNVIAAAQIAGILAVKKDPPRADPALPPNTTHGC